MAKRKKVTLDFLIYKLLDEVIEKFNTDCDPKEMTVKAADFINAVKTIADLKGLKVVPDNTFKGEQDIDFG